MVILNITFSEFCLIKLFSYILFQKYINILALEMGSPGNRHCVSCIDALSFAMDMCPSEQMVKEILRNVVSQPPSPKMSFCSEDLNESTHIIHGSLGPKQHLDRFIRFCTAHSYDQQTDTQTALHR